jgi:hypothetical protein
MNQSVSQRFNILCIKFKMRVFAITALVAVICEEDIDFVINGRDSLGRIKSVRDLISIETHSVKTELLNSAVSGILVLPDSLISHKISSTPPLLIEVSVPSRQSEQSFICVLGVKPEYP